MWKTPTGYYREWKKLSTGELIKVYVHREKYSRHFSLPLGYVIHHINKKPYDNRLKNLVAVTPEEHEKIHEGSLEVLHTAILRKALSKGNRR